MHRMNLFIGLTLAGGLIGCSQKYTVPSRGADFREIGLIADPKRALTDFAVQEALDKKPLATFPTSLALVRIQSPGYTSPTARGWGSGRYSIVTTRDIETDAQIDRLAHLPQVNGLATLNRLMLDDNNLNSDLELRHAAGQLHAEILLIYTLDTTFNVSDSAVPLSVVTLGLSPNQTAHVTTTASAVLVGTHNGYIYGTAEATARNDRLASAWTSSEAVDAARRRTETQAFEELLGELEKTWKGILQQYTRQNAAGTGTNPELSATPAFRGTMSMR